MTVALDIRGLTRRFGERTVLEELDLTIGAGEFVALLGRSGSGKSTLLRVLAGLDRPAAAISHLPRQTAVVFQEPRLMPWKTAQQNVALGLRRPDATEAARVALAEVGLQGREGAWPATLSGGEAQRAALARALVRQPELLLLDEPFAALDALTRLRMHALVADLWRRHRPAILLVTHDVWEAVSLAGRVLVLEEGRIGHQVTIEASYPRRRGDPALADIEAALLARLGVGQKAASASG
ncbi:ABC transporter, ATP-binding protein [Acetobacteraceae bacterium AT-5844]|nr:ABC transporter, ATP-binding protein [Acetobacteraceae bacterium AT-5844]